MASVATSLPIKTGQDKDKDTYQKQLAHAESLEQSNTKESLDLYVRIINHTNAETEALKAKEEAILKVGQLLAKQGDAGQLAIFVKGLEEPWKVLPRAKTARLLRTLLDYFDEIKEGKDETGREQVKSIQMKLCQELVQWSIQDKRAFLKQSLELRLAALLLECRQFSEALALVASLLSELKKMEDKLTLVEVHLLECRIYFVLRNGPKAKAALTAARSNANAIYCPPLLQAALDMQSAILYADESDFKSAYSYFIEALDGYAGQNDPRGGKALKYLILCKIMMDQADDVDALVTGKLASKYELGQEVTAMKAVGNAYKNRSLEQFEAALSSYPQQLGTDPMIHTHFQSLYDQLLQKNLLQIIAPYSRVRLTHIAKAIGLSLDVVESR